MKRIVKLNILAALVLIITAVYYITVYDDVSGNLIRLHVISNSNTEADIKIKEAVRDVILEGVGDSITPDSDPSDILNGIPGFLETANSFLEKEGIGYRAKATIEKTEIPRKEYKGIVLPKGEYTAIRIMLGEGKGENWWCVAYPPLCFTEEVAGKLTEEGEELLKSRIDYKSYRVITSEVKYELKIAEVAKKIISYLKK